MATQQDLANQIQSSKKQLQSSKDFLATLDPNSPEYAEFSTEVNGLEADIATAEKKLSSMESAAAKRQIECPDCTGQQLTNPKKKEANTLEAWFPKMPVGIRNFLQDVLDIASSLVRTQDKKTLFDNGCPTCGGGGQIEDKTDRTQQIEAAKQEAESLKNEIVNLESELGPPGGNRHTLVVGDDMLEVGLGYNDSKSYKIIEEGALAPAGATIEGKAPMRVSSKINAVVGTNPLATPGGHYTIKCSNKFTVRAGAQGIEFSSEGPLTIKAGQTQFIAPEITLGAAQGQVIIEGQHTQINGRSIALTPDIAGKGQVSIGGTLHTTGNMIAQGGAHIEGDLSFISATCPSKLERTKFSGQDIQTTGAAAWQADAARQALEDFVRTRTIRILDPAGISLSVREILNIASETKELLKKSLPLEPLPTGVILPGQCYVVGTLGVATNPGLVPIYNFPHHHILSDSVHTHDVRGPNFNLLDTDEEVRKASKMKEGPAPVVANVESGIQKLFGAIQSGLTAIAARLIS